MADGLAQAVRPKVRLDVQREDINFQADYASPNFSLLGAAVWPFCRQLYARLSPLGLRLADMRVETGGGSIGDFTLTCAMFAYTTSVRIRPERVEVNCFDLMRAGQANVESLTVETMRALSAHDSHATLRSYSVAFGIHGVPHGVTTRDFLNKYTATPPELGTPIGAGTVFYYAPRGELHVSTLTLDLSGVVTDGLFLRTYGTWDAQAVKIEDLADKVRGLANEALEILGLELPEK